MRRFRPLLVLGIVLLSTGVATAQTLSPEEMEGFLLRARIVARHSSKDGVTGTIRATLSDGTLTHDAQIQTIDESRPVFQAGKVTELNFKDTYRFNIAGYRLARLLGMDNVPMSVERRVEAKQASMTWWIDDVKMDEKARLKTKSMGPDPSRTSQQIAVMRVFDELIQNKDRNQGNILWTSDWKMWLIDHTRAFRSGTELIKPEQLTRCDRALLDHIRALTPETLQSATAGALNKLEMDALLARRDRIVKLFDDRIARMGDTAVLFTLQ